MGSKRLASSETRRARILAVARTVFFEHGYADASMSAIAGELGGSKTTLWKYFPGKQALFLAVAEDLIAQYVEQVSAALVFDVPLGEALVTFGNRVLNALMAPPITALLRIVTAQGASVPGLGAMFHERGRELGWQILGNYFEEARQRGLLAREADTHRAAQHFIALCESGCYQPYFMGGSELPGADEIAADVAAAVSAFLRAYGATSSCSEGSA